MKPMQREEDIKQKDKNNNNNTNNFVTAIYAHRRVI